MSDTQTVWMILWDRATRSKRPGEPFEIAEVVPEVARTLKVPEPSAPRLVENLIKELGRLPEGRRYFTVEGNAVVPLPEFARAPKDPKSALAAYPYEL